MTGDNKQRRNREQRRDRQGAGHTGHREGARHIGDPQGAGNSTARTSPCPLAYLITFTTYGTWLHGDSRGSVDPAHNVYGTPVLDPNRQRASLDRSYCLRSSVVLNEACRGIVHVAIGDVAEHRDWTLHAVNVRTNHVHVVVGAGAPPEQVMNAMKSWATRRMVEAGVLPSGTKAWTRHGSTRYLWKEEQVAEACRYACDGQGEDLPKTGE